ncbi:MAG TPA: HEAT repeat domain-containing protein [Pirellulales bacterium]|nr:HEAT repeat domain-containing protein [Pirellulales bacterium]
MIHPSREISPTASKPFRWRPDLIGAGLIAALALCTVGGCSGSQEKDVPQLVEDLHQSDPDSRYTAVKSLGGKGAEAKDAVPPMMAMLKDTDPNVRMATAYALGKLGHAAASAVPALIGALDDSSKDVRYAAAYSLPSLGPDATSAWTALQKAAAQDKDPSVRNEAARSLTKIQIAYKYRRAVESRATAQASGEK